MAEISALTEKQSAERTQLNLQIESLVTQLAAARNDAGQVDTVQKDLAAAHGEIARLQEQLNASERKNSERVALLEKDNEALNARLKQAQSTLDQIAATNRSITVPGAISTPAAAPASYTNPVTSAPSNYATPAPASASTAVTFAQPLRPGTPTARAVTTPPPPERRYHVVAEGESLSRISMRYYGTATRWQDIYDANRDILRGENALRPGQRLRIP